MLVRSVSPGAGCPKLGAVLRGLVLLGCLELALPAAAAEPPSAAAARDEDAKKAAADPPKKDTEFSIVPFVGGNSDMGFGGGYIVSFAGLEPGYDPYVYRIESAGTVTFAKPDEGSGVEVPYVDDYLLLSFPHVIKDRLGLEFRVSYTRESTLKYYGLGNASVIPEGADPNAPYYEHLRVHPTALVTAEYRVKPLVFSLGVSYTQNWFEVPTDSRLAEDLQSDDSYVRKLLGTDQRHGTIELSAGVAWDTRDDETSPTRGLYVTERLDVTPGSLGSASYRFARIGSAACVYVPLIANRRLVFAMRVVSDFLIGSAPFYELPRFDDTSAIGGAKGVRGVPAQRYYGKIKAFTNLELRSELFSARILGDERRFGLTAFTDAGRLWADYQSNPDLDGTGVGLKYGVGGGIRIASGKTFVLRLDIAWSPDANPVSGYLLAGHLF